jgi:NAD+-dependent secondary alcohol dehydrogenase Adh1
MQPKLQTITGNRAMKAAVLRQYDETLKNPVFVTYEDVQDPTLKGPNDVIVRIGGAGVCRTDLHIIEGIWRSKVEVSLPHIMGHENAGWIEEVGSGVTHIKVGDPVICHPLITSGHCLACRRGDDMHAEESEFPGINTNGGYAQYLRTGARSIIKLPKTLAPKDVAPHTDAGLTAYRAAKKASRHLLPGEYAVVIGAGGLGHIGIQVLRALCAARIIIVDRADTALKLAQECGADFAVKADGGQVEEVLQLTGGKGAEAVIDFVGEGDAIAQGLAMTRNAGYYYIVGYGGRIDIPTIDMITSEKTIVGNLVGTYPELIELMALADQGKVTLATKEYRLEDADTALHDLHHGKVRGRAVLVP